MSDISNVVAGNPVVPLAQFGQILGYLGAAVCFFLVKKTSGILFFGPGWNILEVFSTKKAKNMNHGSPLFPIFFLCSLFLTLPYVLFFLCSLFLTLPSVLFFLCSLSLTLPSVVASTSRRWWGAPAAPACCEGPPALPPPCPPTSSPRGPWTASRRRAKALPLPQPYPG